MSKTLRFVDRLLVIGRQLKELGRDREALRFLGRLAALPDVPEPVAEETQVLLADIFVRRRKYRRARRHLSIALLYRPKSARYHYLMGQALAKGRYADLERAEESYRKSIRLDPEQPDCLADFGWVCLRQGKIDEGLEWLCQAAAMAPNEPEIVGRLAKGLSRAGRADEAESVLQAARFRNPRDRRFDQLWSDFQFQIHSRRQEREQTSARGLEEGPVVLQFRMRKRRAKRAGGVRQDPAEGMKGPHRRGPSHRDRKQM